MVDDWSFKIEEAKDRRDGHDVSLPDPEDFHWKLAGPGEFIGLGPSDTENRARRFDVSRQAQTPDRVT